MGYWSRCYSLVLPLCCRRHRFRRRHRFHHHHFRRRRRRRHRRHDLVRHFSQGELGFRGNSVFLHNRVFTLSANNSSNLGLAPVGHCCTGNSAQNQLLELAYLGAFTSQRLDCLVHAQLLIRVFWLPGHILP
jgi:hypothetical protein